MMSTIIYDRSLYSPGDKVEGVAYVQIGARVPTSVKLRVFGRERTGWDGKDLVSGNRYLFRNDIELFASSDSAAPQTTFRVPVSFVIPRGIPDSYNVTGDGGKARASIEYCVEIDEDYSIGTDFDWKFTEAPFQVKNQIPDNYGSKCSTDDEEGPIEIRIMSCCCFYKGSIFGNIVLNQSAYKPGETVCMQMSIIQSKKGMIKTISKNIDFATEIQLSGSSGLENESTGWPQSLNYKVVESKEWIGTTDNEGTRNFKIEFKVPLDAEPSIMGSLSRRMHYIKIGIDTPSTFVSDMYVVVPILPSQVEEKDFDSDFARRVAAYDSDNMVRLDHKEVKVPSHVHVNYDPLGLMETRTFLPRILNRP
jgi:hypothetical protein